MSKHESPLKDCLTRAEAAEYLRVSPNTLRAWAVSGAHNLPYYKHGRHVLYHKDDLDAWLETQRVTHA